MNKVGFACARNIGAEILFAALLAAFFCLPLVRSVLDQTAAIHLYADWAGLFAAVFLTLYYRSRGEPQSILAIGESRILLAGFCLFSVLWLCGGVLVFFIDRYILFFSLVILALALSDAYRKDNQLFLRLLLLKAAVVAGTVLFFALFIYIFQDPELQAKVKGAPPVYHHLRHLNYELFFTIPVLFLLLHRNPKSVLLLCLLFVFFVVSVWTAGRGMFLALVVAYPCVRLRYWRSMPNRLELVALLLLLAAVLFVVATDKTVFLLQTTLQSIDAKSVNGLSSGRLGIWQASLEFFWRQDIYERLFGLGPEAFLRHGVWGRGAAQPHNSLVQILLEFGLVGLAGFVLLLAVSCWKSLCLVLKSRSDVDVLAGALLIGGIVFSLVDGIFYHAIALNMMVIILFFVFFRERQLRDSATFVEGDYA